MMLKSALDKAGVQYDGVGPGQAMRPAKSPWQDASGGVDYEKIPPEEAQRLLSILQGEAEAPRFGRPGGLGASSDMLLGGAASGQATNAPGGALGGAISGAMGGAAGVAPAAQGRLSLGGLMRTANERGRAHATTPFRDLGETDQYMRAYADRPFGAETIQAGEAPNASWDTLRGTLGIRDVMALQRLMQDLGQDVW